MKSELQKGVNSNENGKYGNKFKWAIRVYKIKYREYSSSSISVACKGVGINGIRVPGAL